MNDYNNYLIEEINKVLSSVFSIELQKKEVLVPDLEELSINLDQYYTLNKLRIYCYYLSLKEIVSSGRLILPERDTRLISLWTEIIQEDFNHIPIFSIYLKIYQLFVKLNLGEDNLDHAFDTVLLEINQNQKNYAKAEVALMYSFLTNFCTRQINQGEKIYLEKSFTIHHKIISILFEGSKNPNRMPGTVLKNMVVLALALRDSKLFSNRDDYEGANNNFWKTPHEGAIRWAREFIERFKSKLDKRSKESYYKYCSALLFYEEDKLIRAYRILYNQKRVHGIFINLHTKLLYLKVVYDLENNRPLLLDNDEVSMHKAYEAYRGLLRYEFNKKMQLTYQFTYFETFGKLYRGLINFNRKFSGGQENYSEDNLQQERSKLFHKISQTEFYYREWFLEKLQKL